MKKQALTLLLAAVAVCGLVSSCGKKQQAQPQAAAPEIAVLTVEPSSASYQNSYPATIKGKTDKIGRAHV